MEKEATAGKQRDMWQLIGGPRIDEPSVSSKESQ